MKSEKINNYKLSGSIHTLQIKSADIPEIPAELQECISSSTRKNHGKIEAISIINPNKLIGDCFSFTEFEQSFSSILEECGVGNYSLMRVDFRMDSYESEHYKAYPVPLQINSSRTMKRNMRMMLFPSPCPECLNMSSRTIRSLVWVSSKTKITVLRCLKPFIRR